jgi:hypothetical protein
VSPLEGGERLPVEVQSGAQLALGVEGEAEVVERLARLVGASQATFEGQGLTLRRGGAGEEVLRTCDLSHGGSEA